MKPSAAQLSRLRKYAAPTVLALIAVFQLSRVMTSQQTSWRGGGFGMYADFHPNTRRFWLKTPTQTYTSIARDTPGYKRCANLGSVACLRDALVRTGSSASFGRLELWAPRFNPWTGEFDRVRLETERDSNVPPGLDHANDR